MLDDLHGVWEVDVRHVLIGGITTGSGKSGLVDSSIRARRDDPGRPDTEPPERLCFLWRLVRGVLLGAATSGLPERDQLGQGRGLLGLPNPFLVLEEQADQSLSLAAPHGRQ
jgi:hypothetical protein